MYATTLAGLGHFSILAAFSNISQPMSRPTFFADLFCAHLQTFASLCQPFQWQQLPAYIEALLIVC
jgi:hypothetical protein